MNLIYLYIKLANRVGNQGRYETLKRFPVLFDWQ